MTHTIQAEGPKAERSRLLRPRISQTYVASQSKWSGLERAISPAAPIIPRQRREAAPLPGMYIRIGRRKRQSQRSNFVCAVRSAVKLHHIGFILPFRIAQAVVSKRV
jgi:hypothetical protein